MAVYHCHLAVTYPLLWIAGLRPADASGVPPPPVHAAGPSRRRARVAARDAATSAGREAGAPKSPLTSNRGRPTVRENKPTGRQISAPYRGAPLCVISVNCRI